MAKKKPPAKGRKPKLKHKTRKPDLSAREVRFCRLYAETDNGYRSYLDAGFPEHPTRNATDQAIWRLVRKRKIRERVQAFREAMAEAESVIPALVARGLARTAFSDPRKLYNRDGTLKPPHLWPDDVAAAVVGCDSEEITETREDPATGRKKKVVVGVRHKPRLERRTEAQKVLAQWLRMLAPEKDKTGDDADRPPPGPGLDLLGYLAALVASRLPAAGGAGGTGGPPPGGDAVVAEPGPADPGVPQPGG